VGDRFRPDRAEGAPQAGGELLAPLGDHRRGHPERQVDLGPPAGPVLPDRGREHQRPAVAQPPVDPGDTQATEGPGDHVLAGGLYRRRQGGRGDDRLACGPTGTGQQRERHGRGHHPRPRRGERQQRHREHGQDAAPGEDHAPRGAGVPPGLVDPQVVRQQAVRSGLPLQVVHVRDVPPGEQPPRRADDADQRPPAGEHRIDGQADAVVGGAVPVPDERQLHMLTRGLAGAPVGRNDRLARRAPVGQVGVRRAGCLDGPGLGAGVLGPERDNAGVRVVIDPIGCHRGVLSLQWERPGPGLVLPIAPRPGGLLGWVAVAGGLHGGHHRGADLLRCRGPALVLLAYLPMRRQRYTRG
jgi:hypothetical protein